MVKYQGRQDAAYKCRGVATKSVKALKCQRFQPFFVALLFSSGCTVQYCLTAARNFFLSVFVANSFFLQICPGAAVVTSFIHNCGGHWLESCCIKSTQIQNVSLQNVSKQNVSLTKCLPETKFLLNKRSPTVLFPITTEGGQWK